MPRIDVKLPKVRKTSLRSLRKGVYAAEVMTGEDKWYLMAWAYKEAGDRLAARMTKSLSPWEILAAPMLFLYRHYIELHLKSRVRDEAIAAGIIDASLFDAGIGDLERTAAPDGVFCYTFFKGVAVAP